ncbi:MAG: glycerophosphodiester phosphodiesterase family protein [Clostridia bacterium]
MKKLKIFISFVVLLCCVAGLTACGGDVDTTNKFIVTNDQPLISAHRAGALNAPENTLMAFDTCINNNGEYKVDILEFDLHLTKDDEVILLHDENLDRTSNSAEHFGQGGVIPSDKTYAELRELNMAETYPEFKGLRGAEIPDNIKIVKLETVFDFLFSKNSYSSGTTNFTGDFIIEIKDKGAKGTTAAAKLYKIIKDYGLKDRVILGTFNETITQYFDKNMSDIKRSSSIKEVTDFVTAVNNNAPLKNIKYTVLQIPMDFQGINLATKAIIDYAHSLNLAVQYWTVNNPEDMKFLKSIGADAIISDNPATCYKVLNNLPYEE